jgi:hypothetical protein
MPICAKLGRMSREVFYKCLVTLLVEKMIVGPLNLMMTIEKW